MILSKRLRYPTVWSWRDSLSLSPFLMDNCLLPLLLKRLQQRKNGGNRWSGTLKTLRMSFNPSFGILSIKTWAHVWFIFYGHINRFVAYLLSPYFDLSFSLNLVSFLVLVRYRINGQVEAGMKCFRSACEQGELYSQTYFCLILFFFANYYKLCCIMNFVVLGMCVVQLILCNSHFHTFTWE